MEKEQLLSTETKEAPVESTGLIGETGIKLDLVDEDFGEEYTVTIERQPSGMFVEGNYVVFVYDNLPAAQAGVLPDSRILKLNDTIIKPPSAEDMNAFNKLLFGTKAPFTLVLQRRKNPPERESFAAAMGTPEVEVTSLSKRDLVGVLLAYLSVFLDFFALMMGIPVLPVVAQKLGFDDQALASLSSILIGTGIPGGLITLSISQWKGTKYGILYSMFGTAVTLLLMSLATNFESLAVYRALAGLTGNSVPVASTYIGMVVPAHLRARYFSYLSLCIMFALVIAPTFGGSMLRYGWPTPWRVASGVALFGAILSTIALPNRTIPKKTATDTGRFTKPMVFSISLFFLKFLGSSAQLTMAGNFYIKYFGLDGQAIGYIMTLDGAMNALVTVAIFPFVYGALGPYKTLALGHFIFGLGHLLATFMPEYYYFAICMTGISGIGMSFIFNSVMPIADSWSTPSTRAKIMSFGSIFENLGSAGATLLYGTMFKLGFEEGINKLIWYTSAGASLFSFLVVVLQFVCVYRPALARKAKAALEARKVKPKEHKYINFKNEFGTETDFLEFGKALGTMLSERHYKWVSYKPQILSVISEFFPPLPTDTAENHYRAVQKIRYMSAQTAEIMKDEHLDVTLLPPHLHIAASVSSH